MEAPEPPAFTPEMQEIAALAKALGHPARVAIVRVLQARTCCTVGELVAGLPFSQSTVSQHLQELTKAGLVSKAGGPGPGYCLNPQRWNQTLTLLGGLFHELDHATP